MDTLSMVQDIGYRIIDTVSVIQDTGYRILDTLNDGCKLKKPTSKV